ncbi:MAG: DNA-binding domain-containing protein [Polyangiaceae bacterium]|jgi:hypothetical protein|nr:DNA-binding domain-containing protein [Polyangiaceae bacterium]
MTTDSLRALEQRFFSLVTRPAGPPGAAERFTATADEAGEASERSEAAVPIERWLLGSAELEAADRLGIYASMYVSRMVDVLAEDYRLGRLWLGAEVFDRLAAEYLARHPSRNPSLRHFGRRLPEFVRSHPLGEARPGLADLLALEWARSDAFDAADAEVRAWASFTTIEPQAWPSLQIALVPAARFVQLETSADELWSALDEGRAPPELRLGPRRLLVWRRQFVVYHRPLPDDEASALEAIVAGAPFERVCECFVRPGEAAEGAAVRAFGALQQWAVDELLAHAS